MSKAKTPALELHPVNQRRYHWIAFLVLLTAVLIAMGRSIPGHLTTWDDIDNLQTEPFIANPDSQSVEKALTSTSMDIYIPLTRLVWLGLTSLQVPVLQTPDHLPDFSGVPFHVVNIAAHVMAAWFAYRLIYQLTRYFPGALCGALLFAVHPLQVESVAWVSGLKDVLSGAFSLLALWMYAMYRQGGEQKPSSRLFIMSCVALLLALASKPSALTTILLAAAMEALYFRTSPKIALRDLAIWAAIITPFAITARQAQVARLASAAPLIQRPLVALDSLAFYIQRFLIPHPLTFDYGRRPQHLMESGEHHYTWIIPVVLVVIVFALRKRVALWLPLAIFALASVHTLGFVEFDFQFYSSVADHYAYVMLLGPALGAAMILQKLNSRLALGAMSVLLAGWCAVSVAQCRIWHDTDTLMDHEIRINPNSIAAVLRISIRYEKNHQPDKAAALLEESIRYEPRYYITRLFLGNIYMEANRFAEAQPHFDVALQTIATHAGPNSSLFDDTLLKVLRLCARAKQKDMIRHYSQMGLELKGETIPPELLNKPPSAASEPTTTPARLPPN